MFIFLLYEIIFRLIPQVCELSLIIISNIWEMGSLFDIRSKSTIWLLVDAHLISYAWFSCHCLVNIGSGNFFGAVRQLTIAWANVDPGLSSHMASPGQAGLTVVILSYFGSFAFAAMIKEVLTSWRRSGADE